MKATFEKHGRCVIAASEGIHDENGAPILAKLSGELEKDAHGNVQLSGTGALADLLCEQVKQKLGINRVRGDTFGYLQRSFLGCVSDVDQREAREVGAKAVQYAMWEGHNGSVAIRRVGNYAVDYPLIPLEIGGGQDARDGRPFHRRDGQRRDAGLYRLSAAAGWFRHPRGRAPARREGGEGEGLTRHAVVARRQVEQRGDIALGLDSERRSVRGAGRRQRRRGDLASCAPGVARPHGVSSRLPAIAVRSPAPESRPRLQKC